LWCLEFSKPDPSSGLAHCVKCAPAKSAEAATGTTPAPIWNTNDLFSPIPYRVSGEQPFPSWKKARDPWNFPYVLLFRTHFRPQEKISGSDPVSAKVSVPR